jgi:hypothetical protein
METILKVQELPPEIFFRIFSYLPAMELAAFVSIVCKQWNTISMDDCLWKYHCVSLWGFWRRTQEQIDKKEVSWYEFFKANCSRSNLAYLILGAEGGGATDERLVDVQKKLISEGLMNVDTCNVRTHTPSIDYMKKYNSVMFFSYHGFDQTNIGNLLAEYVDAGGGVVFCAYANCGRGNRLGGKWAAQKYDPLTLGATSRMPSLKLGKCSLPKHPVLYGVTTFDGGEQSSHGDGEAHENGVTIAEWSNGRSLVVELGSTNARAGLILGLNMYPPSSDAATGGWNAQTCGARLLANAMHYVARGITSLCTTS